MRNVQVAIADVEAGDTIVQGQNTFVVANRQMSVNNVPCFFDGSPTPRIFVATSPTGQPMSVVTIQIP